MVGAEPSLRHAESIRPLGPRSDHAQRLAWSEASGRDPPNIVKGQDRTMAHTAHSGHYVVLASLCVSSRSRAWFLASTGHSIAESAGRERERRPHHTPGVLCPVPEFVCGRSGRPSMPRIACGAAWGLLGARSALARRFPDRLLQRCSSRGSRPAPPGRCAEVTSQHYEPRPGGRRYRTGRHGGGTASWIRASRPASYGSSGPVLSAAADRVRQSAFRWAPCLCCPRSERRLCSRHGRRLVSGGGAVM